MSAMSREACAEGQISFTKKGPKIMPKFTHPRVRNLHKVGITHIQNSHFSEGGLKCRTHPLQSVLASLRLLPPTVKINQQMLDCTDAGFVLNEGSVVKLSWNLLT